MNADSSWQRLQRRFTSSLLCSTKNLKRITLFCLNQNPRLQDPNGVHLRPFVPSLKNRAAANVKHLRCMATKHEVYQCPWEYTEVYYHREQPVGDDWWMRLESNHCDTYFAEGRTPRIHPVGKWDWETVAGCGSGQCISYALSGVKRG